MPIAGGEAPSTTELIDAATELEAAGRYREAAQTLEQLPPDQRDPMVDVRIVRLRHQAFSELPRVDRPARPANPPDRFPGEIGAPEVHRSELDADLLAAALHHHGCLIVRELVTPDDAATLRSGIDRAFAEFDDRAPLKPVAATAPWFAVLDVADDRFEAIDPIATAFLRKGGGVYAPHAPRAFVACRDALKRSGLLDVAAQYLGAMPVWSVNKFVLRRISGGAENSWHQDGSYLGTDTNAVNLWLALTECGADTDAMGLDIVPGRQKELAEVGTYDAVDERAISQVVARRLAEENGRPIERPYFGVGDGILFDQFFVHRSDVRPLVRDRYAIESWFFTVESWPGHLIPVVAD
jgi:hypothetical protein